MPPSQFARSDSQAVPSEDRARDSHPSPTHHTPPSTSSNGNGNEDEPLRANRNVDQAPTLRLSGWPEIPSYLERMSFWKGACLFWDIFLALIPALFFGLAISAAQLDGKPMSAWGLKVQVSEIQTPSTFAFFNFGCFQN